MLPGLREAFIPFSLTVHAMIALFWLSFAIVVYTYAGYPLLIALASRLWARPWLRAAWPQSAEAPISILMAVHNGANLLPGQLAHLLEMDPHRVKEIIVVSDGSNDATNMLLERAAETIRLRTILLPERVGKSAALNHAVAQAKGEILLFVDIRPRVEPGALDALLANFADPTVGCVSGELRLVSDGSNLTTSAIGGFYWRYEQWIRINESTFDSPVGVYGGFYAIRRALAVPAPAGLILDDMFQPLAIIRQGFRSVVDRAATVTDRWPTAAAGEFQRKVRTLAGNFQLVALAPWVLSPHHRVLVQLVSHKLLRLAVPWLFLLMLLSSVLLAHGSVFYAAAALLQIAFWLVAAAALKFELPIIERITGPASALLLLNAAAIVGTFHFVFNRRGLGRLWSPATALHQSK